MERIERTVFLSYRHADSAWALASFQNFTQHGYDVFFDYDGIASGDFERVILGSITARAHFLVLLTPSALVMRFDPRPKLLYGLRLPSARGFLVLRSRVIALLEAGAASGIAS